MARSSVAKTIDHVTNYKPRSKAPFLSATLLYDCYKLEYGNNILLDQSIRLIRHCMTHEADDQVKDRTMQAFEQSQVVEDVCLRLSNKISTINLIEKYNAVRDIRSYLADCLK